MSESNISPQALSQFFSNLYHYGLEKAAHRWYSVYEAEVVSITDDPDGTARIDVVCPLISDDTIRHARPIFPNGSFLPPYVGDRVWVMFKHGDVHRPLYVGGWVTISSGEQPAPSDVETATVPTTRVIKFKTGAIVFEDGGSDKRVEIYTKELEGDTKNRRISLSDTMEEIVVEAKNGHYVKINDMENFYKVFVDTSGGAGATGHSFLMDGDGGAVDLKSALGQELLLDDNTLTMVLKNQLGDNLTIQQAKLLQLVTAAGMGISIVPTAGTITIKDVAGNLIAITPAGIVVTSAAAVTTVAAGAAVTTAAGTSLVAVGGGAVAEFGTGGANSFIVGSVTKTIVGALSMLLLGATTIAAIGTYTIIGAAIFLGGAGGAALVTAAFFTLAYNLHTHPVTTAPGATGAPSILGDPSLHATQNVKAT